MEGWSFVILPIVSGYILQFALLDGAAADVDGDVFVLVRVFE